MTSRSAARTARAQASAAPAGPGDARRAGGAIACRGLVRIYASKDVEVQALQGLDLDIASGELVAIVGASGSGKSTLLGILSAHDKPTAGTATVAGMPAHALSRSDRLHYRRRVVGFVWQKTERNLVPYLTVAENLHLARSLGSADRSDARTDDLVDLLQLGEVADRRPAEISGGQRQRAAIAVGLVNEPSVLLADEPTGELDDATSADVLEILRRVNRELGTTTLIVTHDATVSEHVGRTIQIRDGRISSEVLRDDDLLGTGLPAREFTVVDSVGRMQLPKEYVSHLGIRDRARLELHDDHIGVYAEHTPSTGEPPSGQASTSAPASVSQPAASAAPPSATEAAGPSESTTAPAVGSGAAPKHRKASANESRGAAGNAAFPDAGAATAGDAMTDEASVPADANTPDDSEDDDR
ncbi:ABC transporter ATP-binding protein [Planctomonas sp. JC2975]|uniref:ABC transporter ATP-binding protein n=1 Tax=Planctomonas sp. JC2975 TaxID=2729626 RepID=UPI0014734079|nr:ABC transporter ATP-binding protein [Planctomonas sp. JC2975]NNC12299.1 ABC transporter ATP-binding protein [Planctomonas sp. JC2975]